MAFPNSLSGLTWWSVFSNPNYLLPLTTVTPPAFQFSAVTDQNDGNTFFKGGSALWPYFYYDIYDNCDTDFRGGAYSPISFVLSSLDGDFPVLTASTTFTFFSRFKYSGGQESSLSSSDSGGGFVNSLLYDLTIVPYRWYQFKFTPGGTLEFNMWADPNTSSGFMNRNFTPTIGTWYDIAVRSIDKGGGVTAMEVWIDGIFYQSASTGTQAVAPAIAAGQIQGNTSSVSSAIIAEQFWFNRTLDDNELASMFTYFNNRYVDPPCPSPTPTNTATNTVTPTNTATPTKTPTQTPTPTRTPTPGVSQTPTPNVTPTVTPTNTNTPSITPTNTVTPSITPSNSPTPSITPSNTPTPSITPPPISGINFKTIADSLQTMATYHKQINSYGLGDTDQMSYWTQMRLDADNPTFESPFFPLLYIVPSRVLNGLRYKNWEFNLIMSDIVDRDLTNQVDVMSDTLQILQDVVSQYRLSVEEQFGCYNSKYYVDETIQFIPFMEKYSDLTNGWNAIMRINTMTPLDRCTAAYEVFTGSPIVHDSINFKTFHDDFRLLADHHKQLNSFGFGSLEDLSYWTESRLKQDNPTFESPFFPLLYVVPGDASQIIQENGSSYTEFDFNCIVMDILDRDLINQVDVLSDTNQILDDIISQFRLSVTQSLGCFNAKYYLDDSVECQPFMEQYSDLCGGWSGRLRVKVMTPLDRCAAAFDSFLTPTMTPTPTNTPTIGLTQTPTPTNTQTPTETPTNTPTETTTNTPTPTETPTNTPSETPTNTPTNTSTETPTNTPTNTETPTNTPTNTSTPTPTPTCGTFTTQYLEVDLQSCHNFKLVLWNNPNYTGAANAICDYVISGCAYGDQGTVYCGTETIPAGNHQFNFSLQPVLQPGECVSGFTVNSATPQCGCVQILFVQPTPTPTQSPTNTPTPSITSSQTPSQTPSNTPTQTASNTPTNTPTPSITSSSTPTVTPTNTATPTNTSTQTPTNTNTPTKSGTPTPTPTKTLVTACRSLRLQFTSSCQAAITNSNNGVGTCGGSTEIITLSNTTITRCGTSAFKLSGSGTLTVTDLGNC